MVASIKPEYLLGKNDFERWVVIRDSEMKHSGEQFPAGSLQKEQEKYETFSRHAWVDILLQIIKVSYLISSILLLLFLMFASHSLVLFY